jgi:hypothetical protein
MGNSSLPPAPVPTNRRSTVLLTCPCHSRSRSLYRRVDGSTVSYRIYLISGRRHNGMGSSTARPLSQPPVAVSFDALCQLRRPQISSISNREHPHLGLTILFLGALQRRFSEIMCPSVFHSSPAYLIRSTSLTQHTTLLPAREQCTSHNLDQKMWRSWLKLCVGVNVRMYCGS